MSLVHGRGKTIQVCVSPNMPQSMIPSSQWNPKQVPSLPVVLGVISPLFFFFHLCYSNGDGMSLEVLQQHAGGIYGTKNKGLEFGLSLFTQSVVSNSLHPYGLQHTPGFPILHHLLKLAQTSTRMLDNPFVPQFPHIIREGKSHLTHRAVVEFNVIYQ